MSLMINEVDNEAVALLDMDGTVADYDGQLRADLLQMAAPGEEVPEGYLGNLPPHMEARIKVIRRQPGWWRGLPKLLVGFQIVSALRHLNFSLHVLTKGPQSATSAWTEKVEWCKEHLPDAQVTITQDKSLAYGRVLVDDWPPYVNGWLRWRPRGLVVLPAHPWNSDFSHPNAIRYRGSEDDELLISRLKEAKDRVPGPGRNV